MAYDDDQTKPSAARRAGQAFRAAAGSVGNTIAGGVQGLADAQAALGGAITKPARIANAALTDFTEGAAGAKLGPPAFPVASATPAAAPIAAAPIPAIPKPVFNPTPGQVASAGDASSPSASALPIPKLTNFAPSLGASASDAAIAGYNADRSNPARAAAAPVSSYLPEAQGVFNSNAKGAAVVNGRVFTPKEIADAGNRVNTISSENFAHPGLGVATSLATGGQTPTQEQAIAGIPRPATAQQPYNAQDDIAEQQRNAQSDIASILSKDPRSVAGRASWNAYVDLKDQPGGRGAASPYAMAQAALIRQAQGGAEANSVAAANRAKFDNEDRIDDKKNALALQEIQLRKPQATQVPLEGGGLGLLGQDGIVRPALDAATGKPVKTLQPKEDAITGKDEASIAATAAKLYSDSQLSKTPLTLEGARQAAMQLHGKGEAAAKPPSKADFVKAATVKNPGVKQADLEKYYDQKYGS